MLVKESIENAEVLDLEQMGPFAGFLINKRGLPSLQPTLLWQVRFTSAAIKGLDEIIFTDSITVPGESITTSALDLNSHSIQYLISDGRATTNTLSIGFYVDIYSTIERIIYPWMKEISMFGSKADSRIEINLYGFRMGVSPDSDDAIISAFYGPNITRPCYKHYKFVGCFPTSMPEYTYDQANQKWANVRTVTFGFSDYDVELLPIDKLLVKGDNSRFLKTDFDNDQYTYHVSGGSHVYKNILESELTESLPRKPNHDEIKPRGAITSPRDSDVITNRPTGDLNYELMNGDNAFARSYFADEKLQKYPHKYIEPQAPNWGFALASERDGTPNIEDNYDATEQYKKADSRIKAFIKRSVQGYITPDTPIYHGLRAPLSKAIRKMEQWFYTEPKNKSVPVFDHVENDSYLKGNRIGIDADDHPDIELHDKGKQIDIDVLDYAAIHNHAKADTVRTPEQDYMNHIASKKDSMDSPIVIDRQDYVTSHEGVTIKRADPDDNKIKYSSDSVIPDPNDKRNGEMISVDEKIADKNDFVNARSVSINNVIPDSSDASIPKISASEVSVDDDVPNVKSIKINDIKTNENDHNVNTPKDINEKEIDEKDHVDFSGSGASKMLGGGNSTVNTGTIDIKNYKPPANTLPVANKKQLEDEVDYINFSTPMTEKTPDGSSINVEEHTPDSSDAYLDHDQDKVKTISSSNDTPSASSIEIKDVNLSSKDFIIKRGLDLIDRVLPDKNDLLTKHSDTASILEPSVDNIESKHEETLQIDIDKNSRVNTSELTIDVAKTDRSIIDFAKLVSHEIKTEGLNQIKLHDNVKLLKKSDDGSVTTHDNVGNIVTKSDEPQAIGTNRDMGKYVDPHKDDHTRINVE